MKTQVKKIVIGAAALVFAISGVSFADDGDHRHHKFNKKAYRHYKAKKQHPHWNNKHVRPLGNHRDRYTPAEAHHYHHFYDKHHRRWKRKHLKSRQPLRNRYIYKKAHRHHDNFHRRRALREDQIYKLALKDPAIVFKIILKEHGLY